ncbi:hypothetical protein IRZ59_06930, partial [Pseudomonas guariconensis]|uniref:invasin domain 3-containing protein n=1 Tax=Pseudomonas guariconensis TaxID=1288410 RepID=UPI0018AB54C5
DEQQKPVDIALADIQIAVTETQTRAGGIVVAKPERVSAGNYEVRVTAGTTPQSITLTPSVQGTALLPARVSTVSSLPDDGKSTFTANPARLPANDKTTTLLTFTAQDANDVPVEGIAKNLTFAVHGDKGSVSPPDVTVSTIVESAKGRYSATLKGKLAGRYTVTPQLSGKPIGRLNAEIELQALRPVPSTSKLEAKPDVIPANDYDTSTLTFTAKDPNGNPVTGLGNTLALTVTNGSGQPPATGELTLDPIQENGNTGVYHTTVRGLQADTYTFIPTIGRQPVNGLSATVQLTTLPPALGRSTFQALPRQIPASGTDTSTLTFTARDANDKPVGGLADQLKFELANGTAPGITLGDISEAKTGEYRATLQGTVPGRYTFIPHYNGAPFGTLKAEVELQALAPVAGRSKFEIKPDTIAADGNEFSTLEFTAKDINDNPVSGLEGTLNLAITNDAGDPPAPTDIVVAPFDEIDKTGVYTTTAKGLLEGTYTLTPQIGSETMDSLKVNLTLTPLPPAEATSKLTLTRSTMVADDFTTNGIAFEVRDSIGRPITGIAKQITFEITDSAAHPAPSSIKMGSLGEVNNSGVYKAEFVGLLAGDYRITPKINDVPMGKRTQSFALLTSRIEQLRTYGDYLFPRSSGFPTTAYQEATFIPVLANKVPDDLFTWRSSVSWLTFQPPSYFVFTGAPPTDSGHVTITATSKGGNIVHTYDFKITKWYELGKLGTGTDWSAAMKHCASLSLSPVSKAEATKGENARGIGTVASEWGAVQGGAAQDLWLSDAAGAGKYLRLSNGDGGTYGAVIETPGSDRYRSMCRRTLK